MKSILFLILNFVSLISFAQGSVQLAYEDLPKLVKESNHLVKASKLETEAAGKRAGYFGRSLLPKIVAVGGDQNIKMGSAQSETQPFWKAEASINIFRGGKDRLEGDIRNKKTEQKKYQQISEYQDELYEARINYLHLEAIGELRKVHQDAIKTNEGHLHAARKRIRAGIATSADVLEFDLENTLLDHSVKEIEKDSRDFRNKLAVSLNVPAEREFILKNILLHPPDHDLSEKVISILNHSRILQLSLQTDILEFEAKKANRWWAPSLDLFSTYEQLTTRERSDPLASERRDFTFGFRFTLGWDEAFEYGRESSAKDFEAQASHLRAEHVKRELEAEMHELNHEMKLLHTLIHDSETAMKKASELLRLTMSEYNRGIKNGPDVLDVSRKLKDFKERDVELRLGFYKTQARLLSLIEQ